LDDMYDVPIPNDVDMEAPVVEVEAAKQPGAGSQPALLPKKKKQRRKKAISGGDEIDEIFGGL